MHTRPILLSVKEAVSDLGISRQTLYRMWHAGQIKLVKIAGKTMVPSAEVFRLAEAYHPPVAGPVREPMGGGRKYSMVFAMPLLATRKRRLGHAFEIREAKRIYENA